MAKSARSIPLPSSITLAGGETIYVCDGSCSRSKRNTWLSWVATAILIAGLVGLNLKDAWGFVLLLVADTILVAVNARKRDMAQAFLFAVYAGFAIWGLIAWAR